MSALLVTLGARLLPAVPKPAQPPRQTVRTAGTVTEKARAQATVVRADAYFRESLVAIRDWEALLAAWEKQTPKDQRTPVFPVPANGDVVEWPNPIPLMLLPGTDRDRRVHVRLVDGKVKVQRTGANGKVARETSAAEKTLLGYKHPGGGGKDRWYHRYYRKFDGLTTFSPKPTPFALQLTTPLDFGRGKNELRVSLRNVTDKPLPLTVRLDFRSPTAQRSCGEHTCTIAGGKTASVRFPVALDSPGGGMLILKITGGGATFWTPLLVHVEDIGTVLDSVAQILSDTPDPTAADRLKILRDQTHQFEAAGAGPDAARWRALFEQANALRDELLLKRIPFQTLLFVKRKPFDSEQPFMDAHHLRNRPGGGIYRLSPVRPDGKVTPVVDGLGEGIYRDIHLHWTARKFLFAFGNGSDQWDGKQSYHIYKAGVDGTGVRQLTSGPYNDCEPFYLPTGEIGFTSDRSEHFVMCGGNRHSPTLFVMNGDGSDVRQLSFNVFNDFNPTVLPDGRILYSRWEYNERSVTSLHNPFTINPDGTMVAPYYGNATIRPNVIMFPRPVPDSGKVMALLTAHHGQTHGPIAVIDIARGRDGQDPLTILTPNVPTTAEKALDSRHGWFSDPVPLSETEYLCAFTPTLVPWLERSWALYVGDRHGNIALVYRDPEISCAEPVPLVPRSRPHPRPPAPSDTDATDAEGTLLLLDVYAARSGVPRGAARYVRILEDVPRKGVRQGGVITTSGSLIFTIKRVFGTVPIEPDGSAYFVVPANRNVYFEVLDKDHLEIQRMRSVVCLKPGEIRTCVGCHEPRNSSPPNRRVTAMAGPPKRPAPPPWGTRTISYLRDIQPVINAKCVRCHTHDRTANRVILTDDLTNQFAIGYEELLRHIKVAISNRWDHPNDVYARPPYTYGSKTSALTKLLSASHHGVKLTEQERQRIINWIDANGVYYDRYETHYGSGRRIFHGATAKALQAVYARRCTKCHSKNDGRHDIWWMSLNRRDVKLSRAVMAPLARSAGGWGRCGQTVFATANDVDYRALLAALSALRDRLAKHPREDLLSIQGTEAERQVVAIPPPPLPRPPADANLPSGDWVHLSNLEWQSAESGWTPNRDGLPRRDSDIQNRRLRLGDRWFRKGIGTHAPSEIAYQLNGKYRRFAATIGGAEANGTVVFQVFGDDKRLYDSGVMHGLRGVKKVDVPVEGIKRLRLVVTDAGNGYTADMANWAGARLLKAP